VPPCFAGETRAVRTRQYCCVKRGQYVGGASCTGCDASITTAVNFFYQGAASYEQCYTDKETTACIDQPAESIVVPVTDGPITAPEATPNPQRRFAIVEPYLQEGAYQINVGTDAVPEYIYCTGRGTVVSPNSCRINTCDLSTDNFVTLGGGAAMAGEWCYHTCFR